MVEVKSTGTDVYTVTLGEDEAAALDRFRELTGQTVETHIKDLLTLSVERLRAGEGQPDNGQLFEDKAQRTAQCFEVVLPSYCDDLRFSIIELQYLDAVLHTALRDAVAVVLYKRMK